MAQVPFTYLIPLNFKTALMSLGSVSGSGHSKWSVTGTMFFPEFKAVTISCGNMHVLGLWPMSAHHQPGPAPTSTELPPDGISYLVHPVLALGVCHAFIQCVWREDQHKIAGTHDALDQLVLKLPCLQLLHVDEHAEAVQLQVDLQQAGGKRGTAP